MAVASTARLIASLELQDKFTGPVQKIDASLTRLDRKVSGFGKTLGAVGGHVSQGLGNAVKNLERIGLVAGGLAIGAGVTAIKWAGDFEAQLRTINTVARETPDGLKAIGDSIRAIARDTGTPLDELTQGYYDLVSAGIKAKDAQGVLLAANRLAIGGLGSTAETVDLLTTAINAYGGNAGNAAKYADIFAKSIERGKVTAAEIAASFAQVGPLAASYGIEINEIAAAYAQLSAKGFTATDVATEFRSAMLALAKKTPDLEKLEKATGKSYLAIAGKSGLVVALQQLTEDAKKNGVPITDLVGRIEALTFITSTTGPNLKDYQTNLAAVGNSAGTAAAQMAERQQGLNFQLAKLKANVHDAGIEIGTALIPALVELSDSATKFLQGHRDDIATFGKNLAGAFKDGVAWAKRLDWGAIGGALKTAAGAAKGLIDAFLGAPAWLQTAVATGWGLNKLSGGALQNIGGDIAKGIGSRFLERGSSPANPLFVSQTGVPGAGGAGGAAAAGAKGVLGTVLSFLPAIAAAVVAYELATGPLADTMSTIADQEKTNKENWSKFLATGTTAEITEAMKGIKESYKAGGVFGDLANSLPSLVTMFESEMTRRATPTHGEDRSIAMAVAAAQGADGGSHSEDRKIELATIDAIRANTVALYATGNQIESAWLKTIDPEDIAARSKAKTGKDATPAQIAAIRSRDLLHQLAVITTKSKASNDIKLGRLETLAKDAKAHGDTKTATKIQTAIDKMKADIKTAETATTTAVTTGTQTLDQAIAASKSDITVIVNTSVSANDVVKTTQKVLRYGNSSPNMDRADGP